MNRRTLAILLIVIGAIAVIGVLVWTVWPVIQARRERAQQPPPLPAGTTAPAQTNVPPSVTTAPPAPAVTPGSPMDQELTAQEKLKRLAELYVEREGTYSNVDGFASMQEVYADSTSDVRAYLEAERKRLATAYPLSKGSWGQTTKSVSVRIVAPSALLGSPSADVIVQVQRITERNGADRQIAYEEISLNVRRSNGSWLVARIESNPFQP